MRLLRINAYTLTAAGSQLAGLGWDKRRVSIAKSPFVLVCADHGIVQILQSTRAVAREQHPAAFIKIDRCPFSHPTRLTVILGFLSFGSRGEEYELAPPASISLSAPGYFTAYVTAR